MPMKEDGGFMAFASLDEDKPIDRSVWLQDAFPEWGTYLNKEIENFVVEPNSFVLWWFGACAFFIKTPKTSILIDNYSGPSAYTELEAGCGVCRQSGAESLNWMRLNPHVIDPFAIKTCDALLSTHHHADHCDRYTVKPLIKNTEAIFIGPKASCVKFERFGVPEKRMREVKPGDKIKIKDTEIVVLESADRTALFTGRVLPKSMDEVCVTFLIKTPAGNIFHDGDSHYSNLFYKIGQQHEIDVALLNMGENPPGVTDKTPVFECYRIAEALGTKVLIPMHYDNWAIVQGDPFELERIVRERAPHIKTVIMQWGGRFEYPKDQDIKRYKYPDQREKFRPEYSWQYGDKPRMPIHQI